MRSYTPKPVPIHYFGSTTSGSLRQWPCVQESLLFNSVQSFTQKLTTPVSEQASISLSEVNNSTRFCISFHTFTYLILCYFATSLLICKLQCNSRDIIYSPFHRQHFSIKSSDNTCKTQTIKSKNASFNITFYFKNALVLKSY